MGESLPNKTRFCSAMFHLQTPKLSLVTYRCSIVLCFQEQRKDSQQSLNRISGQFEIR